MLTSEKPNAIDYLSKKDNKLANLFKLVGQFNDDEHKDPYAFLVKTIISQTLSNKVTDEIYNDLMLICHNSITPDNINKLSFDDLKKAGISITKVKCILELTNALLSNDFNLLDLNALPFPESFNQLTRINGIGNYTAKIYSIYILNESDIIPFEDKIFRKCYSWLYGLKPQNPEYIAAYCTQWSPYGSTAVKHLYIANNLGYMSRPFHTYLNKKI